MSRSGKILLAMSGGIDSSVSAFLLKESGYEVVGLTLYNWDYSLKGLDSSAMKANPDEAVQDAISLAKYLGIKHIVADTRLIFEKTVVNHFTQAYFSGETPNPCTFCNKNLKWEILLQYAQSLDYEIIATGHYANVKQENGRFMISRGADRWKDQSFMLWQLGQEDLSRTLFPIGHLLKEEIKNIARNAGWKRLEKKPESYNVCFIPDGDYRNFLKKREPNLVKSIGQGDIVSEEGLVIGQHEGFPFYTIGQKKGMPVIDTKQFYVKKICAETNTIVATAKEKLYEKHLTLSSLNFMKYENLQQPMKLKISIRGKDAGTMGVVEKAEDKLSVCFDENVFALMPGQSAVCYEEDDLVVGGTVCI